MIAILSSITTANRIRKYFGNNGSSAQVIQTPKALTKGGCSYSIRFRDQDKKLAQRAAEELGVTVNGYYREIQTEQGRKYTAEPGAI